MSKGWKFVIRLHSVLACRVLVGSVLVCTGCRNSESTADQKSTAAKERISEILSSSTPAGANSTTPDLQSANPVDQIPQGKSYRLAVAAVDRGDITEGDRIRVELSTDTQYNVLATAIQALILIKQNNLDEAMRKTEDISKVPVMQGESYVLAGEIFQRQNRLSNAIGAFESGLRLDPNHVRAHRLLGATYYDTGAMRLATEHLRKAAELDPLEVNALLLSERIFQDYEQYEEAIRDCRVLFTRSLNEDAKNFTRVKLAECLLAIRRLDEARGAIQDCPDSPRVASTRAAIEESAGNTDESLRLAQSVLERVPNDRESGLIVGRILVVRRDWLPAILLLKRMTESSPYDHESRLLYGRALVGSGVKDEGEQQIQKATELKNTFLKFADLHQEAIIHPKDAKLRVAIGGMAEQLGKFKLAKQWYSAAIGLDEQNTEAITALERLNNKP